MMQLPGGLWEAGVRQREFKFKAVDGALELAVAEASDIAKSMPEAVTLALQCSLIDLGGAPPAQERIDMLCIADRQFLMRELGQRLGYCGSWFTAACSSCHETFDFTLDLAELPVQEAGEGYPYVDVPLADNQVRFRLPNGADQEGLLAFAQEDMAQRWLLTRCLEQGGTVQEHEAFIGQLDKKDIERIESALEKTTPAVVVQVEAECPYCGQRNSVDINPYSVLDTIADSILSEVHQIAYHYHWSEAEILGLSRERRRRYLRLIDEAQGMSQ